MARKGKAVLLLYIVCVSSLIFLLTYYKIAGHLLSKDIEKRRDWSDLMNERTTHAQKYCQEHPNSKPGQTGKFFLYEPNKVAYCLVPKNGCTFWKGIMRFLNKDFPSGNRNISTPLDLSKQFIHYEKLKSTPRIQLDHEGSEKLHEMINSFMFARDPYSRLWSAYLDKLFLPDFWNSMGKKIVRNQRLRPTNISLACGEDVSFPEFIRYVVNNPNSNTHFAPIHTICDPCQTNFKFIGKLETFVEDSKTIIIETGIISNVGINLFRDTVIHEMKFISENYLNLKKLNEFCNNKTLICKRLWSAFQKNGYIGFEIDFPSDLSDITNSEQLKKTFIARVIDTYQNNTLLHVKWKKQKRESFLNAYRTVSRKKLHAIQLTYRKDFEVFGYDIEPVDIYKVVDDIGI